jgi:hypothetical protein
VTLTRILALILAPTMALAASISSVAAADIEYRRVEDSLYGVSSVVPADWQDLGGGAHSRGTPPADLALVVIQTAPASIDQVWTSLLPRLGLSEVPEVTEEYVTDGYDWTLYRFDVTLGSTAVAVELALAEADGLTSLVLLQADAAEFEDLRGQVFLPAVDAFAPLAPEATPPPSAFDYRIEEVAFPGGSEGVQLAGTLTMPNTPGPHPVVVMMSGSGPQDRDESLKPLTELKPFAVLADALTSAGVAVLRYDDRGVGGSTGDYGSATVAELAEDARAAIDYLETRDDVDSGRIGLFGHSEGGLYAAMLGVSDPRVAFVGMMAPGVIDGIELIAEQNVAILRASGTAEELVEAIDGFTREALPLALEGDFESLEQLTNDFYGGLWDGFSPEDQASVGDRETFVQLQADSILPQYESDWFRSLLGYEPASDWEQVTVPVLGIFGGKDVQVNAESNEAALAEALAVAGNEDATTLTLPDANHLFQEADTGTVAEYGQLAPEFIDGFVDTIVDWFVVRAGVAG